MRSGYYRFPTRKDWKRIYDTSPFVNIFLTFESLGANWDPTTEGWDKLGGAVELNQCFYEIQQKTLNAFKSYYFLMFFYEKGIPDKRWYISPGNNRESVQYYPDFQKVDYPIKSWFDFFTDTFYYELFSAWDLIGHFLNVKYDLEIKKVSFNKAVIKLAEKKPNLYGCLRTVQESSAYKKARKVRDNIVHNYQPNTPGMAVYRNNQVLIPGVRTATIGLKEYVSSEEIVTNIREILELFERALYCLHGLTGPVNSANLVEQPNMEKDKR